MKPRSAWMLAFVLALAGCAVRGPGEPPPAPAPAPAAAAPLRGLPAPAAAGTDTTPSPEALAVLASIPEPVPATDPVASPAPRDSTVAAADTASVPVPAPTAPLGSESHALRPTPEPPVVASPPAPVAPPAAAAPVAAGPDTCWRVQLGAPGERARGRVLRDASQSLLMVPMTVQLDAGRWKVRTRECLSRNAAESLRDRAVASGFKGVFLVRFVERR